MGRNERGYYELLAYGVGFCLALAMALNSGKAWSGSWEAGGAPQPGPRWTNDAHIADSVSVDSRGCVTASPNQKAGYVPGVDAWGHPVAPADNQTGFVNSLPVELDIDLGDRKAGGHRAEVTTPDMIYDAGSNTLDGYPLGRDCTSQFK
jgi:hypothetical protein